MTPTNFPEANTVFGPPAGMHESQVRKIAGFFGEVQGGNIDGSHIVVVAWLPSDEEVDQIVSGQPVFISMVGGLAPHFVTTSFKDAVTL